MNPEPCASVFCDKPGVFRCQGCNKKGPCHELYCSRECQKDCWKGKKDNLCHKNICTFYGHLMEGCDSCKTSHCLCPNTIVCEYCHAFVCCKCKEGYKSIDKKKIRCSKCNKDINLKKVYSISYIQKLINNGHPLTPFLEFKLYVIYYKDKNIKFLNHLQNSVNGGYIAGCTELGVFYYEGFNVTGKIIEKDFKLAYKYFTMAFKKGIRKVGYYLGKIHKYGQYLEKDYDSAIYFFKKCLNSSTKKQDSYYELGMIYYDLKEYKLSLDYFKDSSINCENKKSMFKLSEMYEKGLGVEKDIKKSLRWCKKSGNKPKPIVNDVKLSEKEEVVKFFNKNKEILLKQYKSEPSYIHLLVTKAVECDSEACYKLWVEYSCGGIVKKDLNIALGWCTLSADYGNIDAMYDYGLYCYKNKAITDKEIFKLFLDSSTLDDSLFMLGIMSYYGFGTIRDTKKAFEYFNRCALNSDEQAMCEIGLMYMNGEGVRKNTRLAKEWLTKSAKKGCKDAQCYLSRFYFKQNDVKLGKYWLKQCFI